MVSRRLHIRCITQPLTRFELPRKNVFGCEITRRDYGIVRRESNPRTEDEGSLLDRFETGDLFNFSGYNVYPRYRPFPVSLGEEINMLTVARPIKIAGILNCEFLRLLSDEIKDT